MQKQAVMCFLYDFWPQNAPQMARRYVVNLHAGLQRHCSVPFDFWVITDKQNYRHIAGLDVNHRFLPTWWQRLSWNLKKIYAFELARELSAYEWVVTMDLDVVVVGDVTPLLTQRCPNMVTCRAAYEDSIGGSVVGFPPAHEQFLGLVNYLKHNESYLSKITGGSERRFFRRAVNSIILLPPIYWQDILPGLITSYKIDGSPNGKTGLVRFHGKPRPHEIDHVDWMKRSWNGADA